ncbi:ABC transporter permease [Streptomyces sp. NPDC047002]|uniref:ABC transporter permease n=1 Tax=Streptomyces sp. NPDC047002 TaxID=3155475 RepID=UPI003453FD06
MNERSPHPAYPAGDAPPEAAEREPRPAAPPGPGPGGATAPGGRVRTLATSRLLGWLVVAACLVLWQAATSGGLATSPVFPPLSDVLAAWWHGARDGTLPHALLATLSVTLAGYAIAAVGGVLLGVLMGRIRIAYGLLEPLIELIRPIPITALVPLLVLLIGIGDQLKIFAVCLAAAFPVILNTFAGIRSVSRTLRETGLTFGLSGPRAMWEIDIRHALPQIFTGLRTALAMSLIIAVFSEMISGNTGIGFQILTSQQTLDVTALYTQVFTLAAVGYLINLLFLVVEGVVLPWRPGSPRRRTS